MICDLPSKHRSARHDLEPITCRRLLVFGGTLTRSPSSALLPFFGGGFPYYRKKGTLILTSLLEDLSKASFEFLVAGGTNFNFEPHVRRSKPALWTWSRRSLWALCRRPGPQELVNSPNFRLLKDMHFSPF